MLFQVPTLSLSVPSLAQLSTQYINKYAQYNNNNKQSQSLETKINTWCAFSN